MMESEDLDKLAEDIETNGLKLMVVLWKDESGKIWTLDGRNRLDAIERRAGPLTCYVDIEGDPRIFSRGKDVSRYVLTELGTDPFPS
jgi:hypothetical protein